VPDQRGCEYATEPPRAGPQGVSEGKARHVGDAKVLVVEDDATVRTALAELIQIWGYSLEVASDGLEALSKASSSPPTVVISDLDMPRMGGLELVKALQHSAPDANCIIVTAHVNAEEAELAGTAGVVDLLEKPIDVKRLRQDLRDCLGPHGAQAPSAQGESRFCDARGE
jgi:two-component system response regulator AtoC